MGFPVSARGSEEESFNSYSTEKVPVGTRMVTEDGRSYRFAENFTSAMVVGDLMQAEVVDIAVSGDQAIATHAAGVTVLTGIGSTTNSFAAGVLANGFVIIDSAADLNPAYRIKTNTAITAGAATGTITLYVPTQAAIAAASTVSFCKNIWRDIIQCPAPLTAAPAGIAVKAVAANEFGWVQTGGPCRALIIGTVLEGDLVVSSATTAGGLMPSAAIETDGPVIGYTIIDNPTTEYGLFFLTFDS